MSLFLVIRHGDNDAVGRRLVGRSPGVALNARGRQQAEALGDRLAELAPQRLVCSPLERTRQTAAALAHRFELIPEEEPGLLEVDFGDWTGCSFDQLEDDPLWRHYHEFRSGVRIPGGEMAPEIQARMVAVTERLRRETPHGIIALVGHGDPIRYLLAFYAGVPLDLALRLQVDVASVSVVAVEEWGAKILCLNSTEGILRF